MAVQAYTTATNWNVTYDANERAGLTAHVSGGTVARFTVTESGLVLFSTRDAVPHAVISAVQRWVSSLG